MEHHYDFSRRTFKWRMLERNRWATIVRTYPGPLLALLGPALALTELALLVIAAGSGWLGQKLAANLDVARALPRLLRERRAIQAERTVSSAAFAARLTAELSSPFLGPAARVPLITWGVRAYWAVVVALLAAARPASRRAAPPVATAAGGNP